MRFNLTIIRVNVGGPAALVTSSGGSGEEAGHARSFDRLRAGKFYYGD